MCSLPSLYILKSLCNLQNYDNDGHQIIKLFRYNYITIASRKHFKSLGYMSHLLWNKYNRYYHEFPPVNYSKPSTYLPHPHKLLLPPFQNYWLIVDALLKMNLDHLAEDCPVGIHHSFWNGGSRQFF